MRRTKILATLGPASAKPDVLEQLFAAGLDAVRLNFSHGTHEQHAASYEMVRAAARRAGKPVCVLQDLQGPKIRVGVVKGNAMAVPTGSTLTITTRPIEGEDGVVSTVYEALPRDVSPGMKILLDDGKLELVVRDVRGQDVVCDVVAGGVLSSKKGINVPAASLSAAAMTDKDRRDALFGLGLGVDAMALSFVRRARDVEDLRAVMREAGRVIPIVAKIEKPQAIDALDDIVTAADGVMVARGDLAVEASLEMVPVYQKLIIRRANRQGKLVITATQMLESMTESPMPTRAEVNDVANAVLDGTDAVMLSGETAVGKHPLETVRRMGAIAEAAEEHLYPFETNVRDGAPVDPGDFPSVVARLASLASHDVAARAIVVFTESGRTARVLSDERPRAPIVALTQSEEVQRQLALYWGVIPRLTPVLTSTPALVEAGERVLLDERIAAAGDAVVYVCGANADPRTANALEIARLRQASR